MLQRLDDLPDAIGRPPALTWSVLARSLGEHGGTGRVALAWRWALTGACPSPVTFTVPVGDPPRQDGLLAEAGAPAELARGTDSDGQASQARRILKWLAGALHALPLYGGDDFRAARSAGQARSRADIEQVYFWALLAKLSHPWLDGPPPGTGRNAFAWAHGAQELLAWSCGEASQGPLSGRRTYGRPTLREVSVDVSRAMTGISLARRSGDRARVSSLESAMETFLWLVGWNSLPPVDRHGHCAFEDCSEREVPCGCDAAGRCLRRDCPACWRVPCVHGFGQDDAELMSAETRSHRVADGQAG
jgi:hypothetical protein